MKNLILFLLSVLVICNCGTRDELFDPREFEVDDQTWWGLCDISPGSPGAEVKLQLFLSSGEPVCPGTVVELAGNCLRYYGGEDVDIVESHCLEQGKSLLYCVEDDLAAFERVSVNWLCVSSAEARRRTL